MATNAMSGILQHLRSSALLPDEAGMTEAGLLEAFITGRDDAAFAALVRRHGPVVYRICRRLVGAAR